jgi:hypothetical protein
LRFFVTVASPYTAAYFARNSPGVIRSSAATSFATFNSTFDLLEKPGDLSSRCRSTGRDSDALLGQQSKLIRERIREIFGWDERPLSDRNDGRAEAMETGGQDGGDGAGALLGRVVGGVEGVRCNGGDGHAASSGWDPPLCGFPTKELPRPSSKCPLGVRDEHPC